MIRIVDYDAGNLTSVKRALDYLDIPCEITPDAERIAAAERVVFPGVGHAASAMETLRSRGLDQALRTAFDKGTPILGICLGTQIILAHSMEGDTSCLGLIDGECPRFELDDPELKIPHMGWNGINMKREHPLLNGLRTGEEFYFVHSFYPLPTDERAVFATSGHGIEFPAVIGERNLVATQFHPEKSGRPGLRMLENFRKWDGESC